MTTARSLSQAIVFALVLVACGDETAAPASDAEPAAAAEAAPEPPPEPDKAYDLSKSLADVTDAEWGAHCAEITEAKGGGGRKVQCDKVKSVTINTAEVCVTESKQYAQMGCDLKLQDLHTCGMAQAEDLCGNSFKNPLCEPVFSCLAKALEAATQK